MAIEHDWMNYFQDCILTINCWQKTWQKTKKDQSPTSSGDDRRRRSIEDDEQQLAEEFEQAIEDALTDLPISDKAAANTDTVQAVSNKASDLHHLHYLTLDNAFFIREDDDLVVYIKTDETAANRLLGSLEKVTISQFFAHPDSALQLRNRRSSRLESRYQTLTREDLESKTDQNQKTFYLSGSQPGLVELLTVEQAFASSESLSKPVDPIISMTDMAFTPDIEQQLVSSSETANAVTDVTAELTEAVADTESSEQPLPQPEESAFAAADIEGQLQTLQEARESLNWQEPSHEETLINKDALNKGNVAQQFTGRHQIVLDSTLRDIVDIEGNDTDYLFSDTDQPLSFTIHDHGGSDQLILPKLDSPEDIVVFVEGEDRIVQSADAHWHVVDKGGQIEQLKLGNTFHELEQLVQSSAAFTNIGGKNNLPAKNRMQSDQMTLNPNLVTPQPHHGMPA